MVGDTSEFIIVKDFTAFDSYLDETYPEHRRWSVTYEPLWQFIRVACSFFDIEEVQASFARLRAYENAASSDTELALRTFRFRNLLFALPIGTYDKKGFEKIPGSALRLIENERERLTTQLESLPPINEWDWHKSREQMLKTWHSEPERLFLHYRNLLTNRATRGKKVELRHYLNLLRITCGGFTQFPRKEQT